MASNMIDSIESGLPCAPTRSQVRPDLLGRAAAPCASAISSGEDRPVFRGSGTDAVNGITDTGPEAHAAVRMHATSDFTHVTGSFWAYGKCQPTRELHPKGKATTTSSAGRLRRS